MLVAVTKKEYMEETLRLVMLQHPNIVQYLGRTLDEEGELINGGLRYIAIHMEYMGGGSVRTYLNITEKPATARQARSWTKQVLHGLAYLHSHSILHHDIKADNILLSQDHMTAKICDFGESSFGKDQIDNQNNTSGWTVPFCAPEVWTGARYNQKADIWALGCTTLEMVCGYGALKELPDDVPSWEYGATLAVQENLRSSLENTWTFSRYNPWNLLGAQGVETFPVLTSMRSGGFLQQLADDCVANVAPDVLENEIKSSCYTTSEQQTQLDEYEEPLDPDQWTGVWVNDAEGEQHAKFGQSHWPHGHSWMLALNNGQHPPIPSASVVGPVVHEFLTLCFTTDSGERPECNRLLTHPFVTGEDEVVMEQAPWNMQASTAKAGFESSAEMGLLVDGHPLAPEIEKLDVGHRSVLLYSLDSISINYKHLEKVLHNEVDRPTHDISISVLYSISLNRCEALLGRVASLCDRYRVEPLVDMPGDIQIASKIWKHSQVSPEGLIAKLPEYQEVPPPPVIIDGVWLLSLEEICEAMQAESTFRIYSEGDVVRITKAFFETDLMKRGGNKDIKIILPSETFAEEDRGRSITCCKNAIEVLRNILQNQGGPDSDIRFLVVGLHGYVPVSKSSKEVESSMAIIASELDRLHTLRQNDREQSGTNGRVNIASVFELHVSGTIGLGHLATQGLSMSKMDPDQHCSVLKIDLGNELLSNGICLVDQVLSVEPGPERTIVTVEEGPTDLTFDIRIVEPCPADATPCKSVLKSYSANSTEFVYTELPTQPQVGAHIAFVYRMHMPASGPPMRYEGHYRAGCRARFGDISVTDFLPEYVVSTHRVDGEGSVMMLKKVATSESQKQAHEEQESAHQVVVEALEEAKLENQGLREQIAKLEAMLTQQDA